ncbi:hypothetical protein HNR44_002183 [Geomicrobium halophilum]|uniref:Uncharacterized protein n=1 Tax=Geomicrobium halophilum TaxID=549000 RepID=A0A841PN63_9BACL|nr:hypothetical protein [Geomicrobium halophilum]
MEGLPLTTWFWLVIPMSLTVVLSFISLMLERRKSRGN